MTGIYKLNMQQVQEKVNGLCNKRCFEASLSYGEELRLEFGNEYILIKTPKFTIKRGEWSLGTRASNWTLNYQNHNQNQKELIVSSNADSETVRNHIVQLENKLVTSCKVNTDGSLQIDFEKYYIFNVYPNFEDSKDGLAYWELLIPNNKVLEVKSNKGCIIWSYLPSNISQ